MDGGGAPRVQRQRVVGRAGRRLPGSRPKGSGFAARQGPGAGRSGAECFAVGGGAPHACNGSVRWGVLGAVSRARARKEGASRRQLGLGVGCSGAECFAVGGGGAPRLQRQRAVRRVGRRFPGSCPEGRFHGPAGRFVWMKLGGAGGRWVGVVCLTAGCGGRDSGGVCCLRTPVRFDPFVGVRKIGARTPCRVLPVAASCACLSFPVLSGVRQTAHARVSRGRCRGAGRRTPARGGGPVWRDGVWWS